MRRMNLERMKEFEKKESYQRKEIKTKIWVNDKYSS